MPPATRTRSATGQPNKTMISIVVMTATIMQVLDTTIANVALPHMQGSLGATQDQIAWSGEQLIASFREAETM